jgi:hypothetical protein
MDPSNFLRCFFFNIVLLCNLHFLFNIYRLILFIPLYNKISYLKHFSCYQMLNKPFINYLLMNNKLSLGFLHSFFKVHQEIDSFLNKWAIIPPCNLSKL